MSGKHKEKNMETVETARQQVAAYEQGTLEAREAFEEFKATNGDELEALKSEFEDYGKHPLWQQYTSRQEELWKPAQAYNYWGSKRDKLGSMGWQAQVLFPPSLNWMYQMNSGDPARSPLPHTVEEFDRRATIARHIGEVATILHGHDGQPIIGIATYSGSLDLKTNKPSKVKNIYQRYTYGHIGELPETRLTIGGIAQADDEPVLLTSFEGDEGNQQYILRIKTAGNIAGIIRAFDISQSTRQLKRSLTPPTFKRDYYSRRRKKLPVGNSVTGDFSIDRLADHDLFVIDAPRRVAADYDFPDSILLDRPKQKVESAHQSEDQQVAVLSSRDTEGLDSKLCQATFISEQGEVSLPAYRHDTVWLVGAKAIAANLESAITENTTANTKRRGTNQALLRVAQELVELADSTKAIA